MAFWKLTPEYISSLVIWVRFFTRPLSFLINCDLMMTEKVSMTSSSSSAITAPISSTSFTKHFLYLL